MTVAAALIIHIRMASIQDYAVTCGYMIILGIVCNTVRFVLLSSGYVGLERLKWSPPLVMLPRWARTINNASCGLVRRVVL